MKVSTPVKVDPANQPQLDAWDGDEGAYWAQHADYFDRSIAVHHDRLMAAAAIGAGERVLDVGCGTGQTTRDAARASGDGPALGVDLSARMLEIAAQRAAAEGLANAAFLQADAQIHRFEPAAFDIAVGRTAAMFFADHVAAFRNIAAALRPGGRLALTVWQGPAGNEWIREITGALAAGRDLTGPPPGAGPFALSDPDRVRDLLTAGGFADVAFEATAAPMWFGTDAADAQRFLLGLMGWMLQGLDAAGVARAQADLLDTCGRHTSGDGVTFASATWTVTAVRV